MIHYHGGSGERIQTAIRLWKGRHAMVSFAYPSGLPTAAEVAQSFALDNGAYSAWQQGTPVEDWKPYVEWVRQWHQHPGFDWALIPDVIDGDEDDNDDLIRWFNSAFGRKSLQCPVWHLHESMQRLTRLLTEWPRVALGSSAQFAEIGTPRWWTRMSEAMEVACDDQGRPVRKLHLLRGLDSTILSHIPASSADSCHAAIASAYDRGWSGPYQPATREARALIVADRIESHATASRWSKTCGIQKNLELIG